MSTHEKDFIEVIASAPAEALDKTLRASRDIKAVVSNQPQLKKAGEYWNTLGPGLTTGAADDDPSGIATYSQAGAQFGNQFLWLAIFTYPFMSAVQEMCARIGLVTGRGLAANIRQNFPRPVLYVCTILLFLANTLNIGANLGAMAKSAQLLFPSIDFTILIILFTAVSLAFQIFISYATFARYLKWLALILLSYIITAFVIPNFDWHSVVRSAVVPSFTFSKDHIFLICAILGTTISPYLFFWQTSQEVEEKILEGQTTLAQRKQESSNEEITNMRIDVWSGMFLSNIVMFFIIAVSAGTLHLQGMTTINTAADAAAALKPLAGNSAYLLFALGIIGTGMLSVPVLAGSSAYALAESLGWKQGLFYKLKQASAFYGVIIFAMLIGLIINFIGLDPIKTLIYSAVANGLVAPVILALIILLSSNKKVMGNRVNHPFTTVLGWFITTLMIIAGIATIVSFFL